MQGSNNFPLQLLVKVINIMPVWDTGERNANIFIICPTYQAKNQAALIPLRRLPVNF